MPRITRDTVLGKRCVVFAFRGKEKEFLKPIKLVAYACDTDEKWVDVYLWDSTGGLLALDGELQTARFHVDFDVVDRSTNEVLYSVRQKPLNEAQQALEEMKTRLVRKSELTPSERFEDLVDSGLITPDGTLNKDSK